MLNVKRISSVKDVQKNWQTSWGSYDRDFSRAVAVDISLWNMRKAPETVTLEVLFIAKPLSGDKRWVFDRVVEEIELDQTKPYRAVKMSKALTASVQNYAALGVRDEAGGQIDGFIVRVLQGDMVIKVEASSFPLKRLGSDKLQIALLIKAEESE
jgi:hypothetical protein